MSAPARRPPLRRPVRCEDCAHGWALKRICTLDPLSGEWPGTKRLGCLYYKERGRGDARGGR